MTIHLPHELEQFVRSQVLGGKFTSEEDAITEAVRLLRQQSQEAATEPQRLTEREFEQRLLQDGFLTSLPSPHDSAAASRVFQPIAIKGEPLSETVIRERR